ESPQDRECAVRLDRVGVQSVRTGERFVHLVIPIEDRGAAVDVERRPILRRDPLDRDRLTVEPAADVLERIGSGQYARAQTASSLASPPHTTQRAGASGVLNSSNGSTRIVAFVSSFTRASHSAEPHQPAYTKPPDASMISRNRP